MAGCRMIMEKCYRITCSRCNKDVIFHGSIDDYKYKLRRFRKTARGNNSFRLEYCCSWTCYVRHLIESTLAKPVLDAQDVILLLRYRREVPWDKVAKEVWNEMPSREALESEACYLK